MIGSTRATKELYFLHLFPRSFHNWSSNSSRAATQRSATSNILMAKFRLQGTHLFSERLFVLWNTLWLQWVKVKKLLLRKVQAVRGQNMFSPSFKVSEEQSEFRWLSFQLVNTLYIVSQDTSHPLDKSLGQSSGSNIWDTHRPQATGKMQTSGENTGKEVDEFRA